MKPSLYLVDFEHLKMEIATLTDKTEARGKQLLESQQQAQAVVHVRCTSSKLALPTGNKLCFTC
jgi:hypothetical protein